MAKKEQFFSSMVIMLSNGNHIDLTITDDDTFDEVYNELFNQHRTGMYYIGNYSYATAMYNGTPLQYINMDLVVGTA